MKAYKRAIVAAAAFLSLTLAVARPTSANEPTNNNYSWANGANNQWNGNMTVLSAWALWATWPGIESITPSGDVDYLLMTCGNAHIYALGVDFTHANGDIDVQFYTTNGTWIATSNGTSDGESMTFPTDAYQAIVMKVYGYAGATNTYTPTISCI